jgi:hypothetical protein
MHIRCAFILPFSFGISRIGVEGEIVSGTELLVHSLNGTPHSARKKKRGTYGHPSSLLSSVDYLYIAFTRPQVVGST